VGGGVFWFALGPELCAEPPRQYVAHDLLHFAFSSSAHFFQLPVGLAYFASLFSFANRQALNKLAKLKHVLRNVRRRKTEKAEPGDRHAHCPKFLSKFPLSREIHEKGP
jgi:hypothetical protein